MTIHHRARATGAVLAALALTVSACGRDGGDGGSASGGGDDAVEVTAPGVSSDPCPDAVNEDNGCIYLGSISDLTAGPFAALGVPITESQEAFWKRVNEDGGIRGFDINVTEYVRDNLYSPETHAQVYAEIEPDVLALAQTLGSPTTLAILEQMKGQNVIGAPASWTSLWGFEDNILESGSSYCVEAMNVVDYVAGEKDVTSVMAIGFPGDYGEDGAAGAEAAAEAAGAEFEFVETAPGAEGQAGAVSAVVSKKPDLVILGTGPTETAVIVGQAAAGGYTGQFAGLSPTWNPALLDSPAAQALEGLFIHVGPWGSFGTDTPGHTAMREALGGVDANDGYTSGWAWSYPLKAALEAWLEGDTYEKTREGLIQAVGEFESVDYEGMLPEEAGDRTGDNDIFTQSVISKVDPAADAGLTVLQDFTEGSTAAEYSFEGPCFEG